jgi:UDP-N-acetylmuramoyl-tripeptide--D-alanyl-D-alanine ligase
MFFVDMIANIIFVLTAGYYLITNLQWYNYKIERVLFHHTKTWWHLVYFLAPLFLYYGVNLYSSKLLVSVSIAYLGLIYLWYRGLDKPLVFTARVKRFFIALLFWTLFLIAMKFIIGYKTFTVILPLILALLTSLIYEKILFKGFEREAKEKIENLKDLKVIGVTASYGKTSIKNFIAHILSKKYRIYATPRSVNTLGGVIRDINESLNEKSQIYVVEMGARERGDILEITKLVNPHYAIVGQIGTAHIEYFKSLENIRDTKMEIIHSKRLIKAFVHKSANIKPNEKVEVFGDEIEDIKADLNGIEWRVGDRIYKAPILGSFNATNLTVAIKIAKLFGMSDDEVRERLKSLKPTPHRLQRIDAGGKIIIDDSFNGNIDGMMEAFKLASTHSGRKVLITPALVEVDRELNEKVAKEANRIFDLVIITSELNYPIFKEYIDRDKLLKLDSKANMEKILAENTKSGDLILFANDAPSFI